MVNWNVNYEGGKFCCLKAEGDLLYDTNQMNWNANNVLLILGKDVCIDVCSMLMCKYTCVLDYVNVWEYVMGKRKMIQ